MDWNLKNSTRVESFRLHGLPSMDVVVTNVSVLFLHDIQGYIHESIRGRLRVQVFHLVPSYCLPRHHT